METTRYRKATPEDADAIVRFQLAMAWETEKMALDRLTCVKGVQAVFDQPERGQYFVAEWRGIACGSLLITQEWSDWRNGSIWWIQSVYVDPGLRRRGLFRGLYEHIRKLAQEDPSVRGLRLYVDQSNKPAQAVYSKLGMNGDHYSLYEWMKA